MPRAKVRKTSGVRRPARAEKLVVASGLTNSLPSFPVDSKKLFSRKYLISAAIVLVLALLVWKNKGLFVAATVNGQPVPRWELESRLVSRYGSQTLDEVINETLIRQAGKKSGASVTSKEIDAKVVEIEKSLEGRISLADALSQQGMTMAEFRGQVELQLILDKLSANSVVVTDQEVADYIASNSADLTSTDPASQAAEAKELILSQKKNAAYRQLFEDLKSKAVVTKFL